MPPENLKRESLNSPLRSVDESETVVDRCIQAFDILRKASHALFLSGLQPEMQGCYSVSGAVLREYNGHLEQWMLSVANMGSLR